MYLEEIKNEIHLENDRKSIAGFTNSSGEDFYIGFEE
jgi:hypothetical protein